jgi:hypothetical protein
MTLLDPDPPPWERGSGSSSDELIKRINKPELQILNIAVVIYLGILESFTTVEHQKYTGQDQNTNYYALI